VSRALAEVQRGAEVLNDGLLDEATVDAEQPPPESLHAPLVATFELADKA
jgi:hypothetical protein